MGEEKNKLDDLTDEIKRDLNFLILRGDGPHTIKKLMERKWVGKTDLLPASHTTYLNYKHLRGDQIFKEKKIADDEFTSSRESFKNLDETSARDTPAISYRNRLGFISDTLLDCMTSLKEQQAHGFSSPQAINAIANIARELAKIQELTYKLQEELGDDIEADRDVHLKGKFYSLFLAMRRIWKKYFGDKYLKEFVLDMSKEIKEILGLKKVDNLEELDDLNEPKKVEEKTVEEKTVEEKTVDTKPEA